MSNLKALLRKKDATREDEEKLLKETEEWNVYWREKREKQEEYMRGATITMYNEFKKKELRDMLLNRTEDNSILQVLLRGRINKDVLVWCMMGMDKEDLETYMKNEKTSGDDCEWLRFCMEEDERKFLEAEKKFLDECEDE
jgi:ATP-dependent Clp protease ATP-binding subunit ClpA